MGTGAQGRNGTNPIVARQIWEKYNLPRSSHRLEVQVFNETEMKLLQNHEIEFSKHYQTLPKFAPNILAYILVGGKPAKLIIHQRMLTLLMNVHRKNGLEAEIGKRQLSIKKPSSQSWFHRVNKIAKLYNLPSAYTILNEIPWDKTSWKNTVKNTLHDHQVTSWKAELAKGLPCLVMLNPVFMVPQLGAQLAIQFIVSDKLYLK